MAAASRDDASPLGERLGIDGIILGLASDLAELRAGRISVDDAKARAELAKQIMNGVRLALRGQQFLASRALPVPEGPTP